jgi:hypothetical protein
MKNLIQDRRSPGRELNPSPSDHETGMVAIRPRRSVVAQEKKTGKSHRGNFCRFPTHVTRSLQVIYWSRCYHPRDQVAVESLRNAQAQRNCG